MNAFYMHYHEAMLVYVLSIWCMGVRVHVGNMDHGCMNVAVLEVVGKITHL